MPFVVVNDQKLYYTDTGGDGPVILFSHGLFMNQAMFAPQIAALRDTHRCIAWDERGHGQTGPATAPFSYYDSAADAVGLLHALGIEQAVFAGMSQGGFLSLRAALRHPQAVRALVLLDTQAGTETPEDLAAHARQVDLWRRHGLYQRMADGMEQHILGKGFTNAEHWKAQWGQFDIDNVAQLFRTLDDRDDLTPRLNDIKAPALVVHGEADSAIPIVRAEALAAGLNAELVCIANAGHAANLTHPDAVNPAIRRFLDALD